jgi:DNA replication protein DnaC
METRKPGLKEAPPVIGCDQCDGYGNLITPQGIFDCQCKTRAFQYYRLRDARIPPMYVKKTLDSFQVRTADQKKIYNAAKTFLDTYETDPHGLIFMGGCGTGKTHMAVALLRELIQKGNTGLFYNVITLLDELRATFDEGSSLSQWPILEKIQETDILVLDDLGAEKTSGWVNDRLYAIINHRYENKKPIIVTTNREITELKDQVGNRIYSRLMEMCRTILFAGKDYRLQMMQGKF